MMQQLLKTIWVSYHHIIDDDAKISQDYDILYIYDCCLYDLEKKGSQYDLHILLHICIYIR